MTQEKINRIAWPTRTGFTFTDRADVLYCKAEGSYTRVHLRGGQVLLVSHKLKKVELLLGDLPFFRIHDSHIANLAYATELRREDGSYFLQINGSALPVAKTKKKPLVESFAGFYIFKLREYGSGLVGDRSDE